MKIQIFRVETDEGQGAYAVGGVLYDGRSASRHPPPGEDAKMAPSWNAMSFTEKEHYFFGFSSKGQLLRWFFSEEIIRHAHECGLGVSIYEVDEAHTIIGHTQAVFVKSEATKVDRFSLLEFLDE